MSDAGSRAAGLLAAIADGHSRVADARALRAGTRILVIGADTVELTVWRRALTAAGARVTTREAATRTDGDHAWLDADLVIDARRGPGDDGSSVAGGPGRVIVCDRLVPEVVSSLLRRGALDILVRPVSADQLVDACRHAVARAPARPLRARREGDELPVEGAIGAALARTRLPVLIVGETGTGKSRAARTLHETLTPGAPFVEINAAGLAGHLLTSELFGHERGAFTGAHASKPGLVSVAHGGTLFLDEIGELSPDAQAQLLSFLDTGAYRPVGGVHETRSDARVVCATNRDLRGMIGDGRFREDLYYRLASIVVPLQPLRAQRARIPTLVRDLAHEAATRAGVRPPEFDDTALEVLASAEWPGNVRQLRFAVERIVALFDGERLDGHRVAALIPEEARHAREDAPNGDVRSLGEVRSLAEMERDLVERAMRAAGGNRTRAAALLGITPRGLYNKLRRNGTTFRSSE